MGCTVIVGIGDFEVVDGGPGGFDASVDTTGPECQNDMDCNATRASATCSADGVCVLDCDDGFADCDMAFDTGCEINTMMSLDHCNGCGDVCNFDQASETCDSGTGASPLGGRRRF